MCYLSQEVDLVGVGNRQHPAPTAWQQAPQQQQYIPIKPAPPLIPFHQAQQISPSCSSSSTSSSTSNTTTNTTTSYFQPLAPAPLAPAVVVGEKKQAPVLKRKAKKSVKFSFRQNKVHVRHLSLEDLQRAWHSKQDYKTIMDSARTEVMNAAISIQTTQQEPADFTARGLESHLCQKIRKQRQEWIASSVGMVLFVQALQKQVNNPNPELLKSVCEKGSATARIGAVMLAALDTEFAKQAR